MMAINQLSPSDEDLVAGHEPYAYEHEDSELSKDVMFIEEERIDSVETGNEVDEDSEDVNLLEGTADTVAEFLPLEKAKSPVWQYFGFR